MASIEKLFTALSRTRKSISDAFSNVLQKRVSTKTLEELEDRLIAADLGLQTVDSILKLVCINAEKDFVSAVKEYLISILPANSMFTEPVLKPTVILVVGVNGTGKTTTTAKLARYYRSQGQKVLLIGTDTYRAAAVEQLKIWADRLDVRLICNKQSREPSAVLFDGLMAANAMDAEVVIVDTAGRLHTYEKLMKELGKMYRVVNNRFPEYHIKSFITIDANLGQNSLIQAKEFANHLNLDGAILTKLDGTAKGGIIFSLNTELKIPVEFIGIGEDLNDLYPFQAKDFVNNMFRMDGNKE